MIQICTYPRDIPYCSCNDFPLTSFSSLMKEHYRLGSKLINNSDRFGTRSLAGWAYRLLALLGLACSLLGSFTSAQAKMIQAETLCRSEEHTSELQSRRDLVCRLLLEKKKKKEKNNVQYQ